MAVQFNRILCPVDFDDDSMQTFDKAARAAQESTRGNRSAAGYRDRSSRSVCVSRG